MRVERFRECGEGPGVICCYRLYAILCIPCSYVYHGVTAACADSNGSVEGAITPAPGGCLVPIAAELPLCCVPTVHHMVRQHACGGAGTSSQLCQCSSLVVGKTCCLRRQLIRRVHLHCKLCECVCLILSSAPASSTSYVIVISGTISTASTQLTPSHCPTLWWRQQWASRMLLEHHWQLAC